MPDPSRLSNGFTEAQMRPQLHRKTHHHRRKYEIQHGTRDATPRFAQKAVFVKTQNNRPHCAQQCKIYIYKVRKVRSAQEQRESVHLKQANVDLQAKQNIRILRDSEPRPSQHCKLAPRACHTWNSTCVMCSWEIWPCLRIYPMTVLYHCRTVLDAGCQHLRSRLHQLPWRIRPPLR